jgi:hypothetical protein
MRLSSYLIIKFNLKNKSNLKEFLLLKKINIWEFQSLILNWLESIKNLKNFPNPDSFTNHFLLFKKSIIQRINLTDAMNNLHPEFSQEKIVEELDLLFEVFFQVQMTALQVKQYGSPPEIPELSNLLENDENGVGINMCLYLDSQKITFKTPRYYSAEGNFYNHQEKAVTQTSLNKSFTPGLFNQTCIENLKQHSFHAEEHWFGKELKELLNYLQKNKKSIKQLPEWMQEEWDTIWFNHLQNFPRIEFNQSSSPCEQCRHLFYHLREILNKNGIFIPIIINYIHPYLTAEVTKSQTLIVPFNAQLEFIRTELCLKTTYKNDIDTKILNFLKYLDADHLNLLEPKMYDLIAWMRLGGLKNQDFSKIHPPLTNHLQAIHNPKDLVWLFAALQRMPKKMLNQDIQNTQLAISSIFYQKKEKQKKSKNFSAKNPQISHQLCLNFLMNLIVQNHPNESIVQAYNFHPQP